MAAKVFIDGDVGTTGLQIRRRLEGRTDLQLIRLSEDRRKDADARRQMLAEADVAILCLPDDASREAAAMADDIGPGAARLIDASSTHRVTDGWVYGMPEWDGAQPARIAEAGRVANPGCYAISSIAMLHPLVEAGIIPADHPVTLNAISGYSGGGKKLIASFEDGADAAHAKTAYFVYGLSLTHKHIPEIQRWGGLANPPLFMPSVGRYRQGMITQLPLILGALPGKPSPEDIHGALAAQYAGCRFLTVADMADAAALTELDPESVNGTNELRLHVFANAERGHVVVAALIDNLGKGASGLAVQNLNLMLGVDEGTGLEEAVVL